MNKDDFIAAIKVSVHDSAIRGMRSILASPPGRKPHDRIQGSSTWFTSLPEQDKRQVEEIIKQAVHASVLGFLCVLDGVTPVEASPEKGSLELIFSKNGEQVLINDECGEMLHDIYQSLVYKEIFEE